LDYLRSALDGKRGSLERQPTKHVRTHTHRLKPLNHVTVVPHPVSPLRFQQISVKTIATHKLKPLNHFTVVPHPLSPLRFNTLGSCAFLADVWSSVFGNRAVILKTNWRQIRDPQMLGLLLRLRKGQHTDGDMALLATRRTAVFPPNVICLFCHELDATDKNEEELQLLPGPSVVLNAVDEVQDAAYLTLARASALLDGELKLARVVSLRVGAVVAVPTACLASQGVPCGTRGIVVRCRALGRRRNPRVRFAIPTGTS